MNHLAQHSKQNLLSRNSNIIYRYKNLIELDYHINASFDGIRETGFWDNGSEIPNDWWFRNSDFETNYSHSLLQDQVNYLNYETFKSGISF